MKRLKFLKKAGYKVYVGKLPGNTYGITDTDTKVIILDPFKDMVLTFVHEYMHARKPKASEAETEKSARKITSRMSHDEVIKLACWILKREEKK